jgi:FKBP-type peptidyl-prolyl cis-trans isomerase
MRALKILALVLMPVAALTACEKKSDAATSGASYDTSADANTRFLADYAARPGVTKLPDGLMYRVIKSGTGPAVQKNSDVVTVYYKGALITGKVFDQTKPEEPAQFQATPGRSRCPPIWAMARTAPATPFRQTRPWSSPWPW